MPHHGATSGRIAISCPTGSYRDADFNRIYHLLPADLGSSPVELLPHSSHVKLPKLSLKRFNSDPTKWMTFWDTFESAVHDNAAQTNTDKFSYLTPLLELTASEAALVH